MHRDNTVCNMLCTAHMACRAPARRAGHAGHAGGQHGVHACAALSANYSPLMVSGLHFLKEAAVAALPRKEHSLPFL